MKFHSTSGNGGISTSTELLDYLNRLGDQCWEVTGVLETDSGHHYREFIILMKRPKTSSGDQPPTPVSPVRTLITPPPVAG